MNSGYWVWERRELMRNRNEQVDRRALLQFDVHLAGFDWELALLANAVDPGDLLCGEAFALIWRPPPDWRDVNGLAISEASY